MSLGADIWGALLASWPYSERVLVTVGLWIAISGTFLSMNALLHLCHVTNSCKRYKIQVSVHVWLPFAALGDATTLRTDLTCLLYEGHARVKITLTGNSFGTA